MLRLECKYCGRVPCDGSLNGCRHDELEQSRQKTARVWAQFQEQRRRREAWLREPCDTLTDDGESPQPHYTPEATDAADARPEA